MKSPRSILTAAVFTVLAATAFAIGNHLGPDHATGRNLLHVREQSAEVASTSSYGLMASYSAAPSAHRTDRADTDSSADDVVMDGPGATFEQVYLLLKHNYVEGISDDSKLGHGAAAAMLTSLEDPDSRFLEPPDMTELKSEMSGTYHGIGAVTTVRSLTHGNPKDPNNPGYVEYRLTIVAPLPDSPAEKAGLKPGDVITHIDGKWLATFDPVAANAKELTAAEKDPVTFNKLAAAIQKQVDTAMSLKDAQSTIATTGAKPITLTISRPDQAAPLQIPVDVSQTTTVTTVTSRELPGNIGYVRISQLTSDTGSELTSALSGFGNDIKGLIVDLRSSPGGQLTAAETAAGLLTNQKSIGVVHMKSQKVEDLDVKPQKALACPIVALIDGGTANASELLAAAMQADGDKLIGSSTFGDASDVAPVVLRDGSGFTMTVGQISTPQHRVLTQRVRPDVVVAPTAQPEDVLNQALTALSGRVAVVPSAKG